MTYDPFGWIDAALAERERAGLLRELRVRQQARPGGTMTLGGMPFVNFSSNDYLGLAADPRLAEAAAGAARADAWGAGASPLVTGRTELHAGLELALANFERTEAALLFTSGYAANAGTIPALVGRGDVVFSDAKNHASLIDGCRLSGARVVVYPHNDAEALSRLLDETPREGKRLIVSDSVFSMDGDAADLATLGHLAERRGAMLLVDEAHATGVFGERGSGLCEEAGLAGFPLLKVGTLSKALGSHGAFVAGPRNAVDLIAQRARSYVFSTAAPAALAAAGLQALDLVRDEPWRRLRVRDLAARVRTALAEQGWHCGAGTTQIVPVYVGEPTTAVALSARFAERGFWVPAIRPPSVPPGESLLRISLSAAHSNDQIAALLDAFRELHDRSCDFPSPPEPFSS